MIIFAARPLNAPLGKGLTRLFSAPDDANMALTVDAVKLMLQCTRVNMAFLDETPEPGEDVVQLGSEVVA